ncbi:glutamine--fructose-6-phosphate transaminase (isomerizing) [Candidatus Nitrospira bockiana]
MCGIVGYVGEQQAVPILTDALKRLEYRGYDSAGVAVLHDGVIQVRRSAGKLQNLERLLSGETLEGRIGIGHTRWATHGKPTELNAHPHRAGGCVLVHNGIIENYAALKQQLQTEGCRFESETDTEVVAHLVARYYEQRMPLAAAVERATSQLRGSYALAVIGERDPGALVAARSGCPLMVGRGSRASFVASDVTAMLPHTTDVLYLEDGDVATVTAGDVEIRNSGAPAARTSARITWDLSAAEKSGYPHFMLKEIHEQPQTIRDTLRGQWLESGETVSPALRVTREQAIATRRIWLVGCGTSWHAALLGKYLLEEIARMPAEVDIASEFRYRDPLIGKDEMFVAISQSGETADTLAAAQEAKAKGARAVAIVNVVGSTLARGSDGVFYTRCGPEIGVASTKAFTGQLVALYALALQLGRLRGAVTEAEDGLWRERLSALPAGVEHILKREAELVAMATRLRSKRNVLYLGRGINYPVALEGALKLKEISYIHAEGYPAGEMKHGPIALLDKDTPVVVLAPRDRLYEKTMSNLMEAKARHAPVFAFVEEGERDLGKAVDGLFTISKVPPLLTPVLYTVALQLLAYHVAVLRGADVDQPRNLAKSVTVE